MNRILMVICFLLQISNANAQVDFYKQLSDATITLTNQQVVYDGSYFAIAYPNGDIPKGKGVCTDVIIRAYRILGIDLQNEVHEDMMAHFEKYPKNWGLKGTDKNIDHRRVPNLMVFFSRKGEVKTISNNEIDYLPGDIVAWRLSNGLTHIGLIIDRKSEDGRRNLIVHNIGAGQVAEDVLFDFKIIGHYRYN